MELHQLEYFVAVAEELSFTRGARRAHVVQSAVSAAITRLERELNAPLFERSRRRVALTDAGTALLPEARATLAAAQGARDAVAAVRGGLRGAVSLGIMLSNGPIDLATVLGGFHRAHPEVVVHARQAAEGTAAHLRDLRDGALDIALVALPGPPPAGIVARPIASEYLVLLTAPDGPYAGRTHVSLEELAAEPFIESPSGWGNRAVADRAFTAHGLQRTVRFEVTDYQTMVDMVRGGLGVAFMPATSARLFTGVPALTVTGDDLTWTVSVAVAQGRRLSAAAHALLADLTAVAPHPGESQRPG
ncbi:MAG TPA: LysR family transcriptional regulator [Streptosporangiaceae bacterium]|nr:LysR family transcriptional regulator [Streptosporangiaceae bacterium]